MATRDSAFDDGVPCWVDLMTTDVESARNFYGDLLGWEFDIAAAEQHHYSTATLDGKRAAGIFEMEIEHPPVWTTYLTTSSADDTTDNAVRHGATIVQPTMDIDDIGRQTILQDPTGGTFGIWQARQYFGTEVYNQTGAVIWNEFMTRDYDAAREFFTAVFSYTYQDMSDDMPEGMNYSIIEVDGNTAGGIGSLPPDVPEQVPPHWRVYFGVDDADEAVAKAVSIGATVTMPATDMPYGRQAGLLDPQGGSFTIIKSAIN